MLTLIIGAEECYDSDKSEFVSRGGTSVTLEHSLVALSKWESIFAKPFLGKEAKTDDEMLTYISCMALGDVSPDFVYKLTHEQITQLSEYINQKATATWINERPDGKQSSETVTSELIYYWMTAFRIPFEAEKWHLQRLFTLIRVAGLKNQPAKKMSPAEARAQQRELNRRRQEQFNSKG